MYFMTNNMFFFFFFYIFPSKIFYISVGNILLYRQAFYFFFFRIELLFNFQKLLMIQLLLIYVYSNFIRFTIPTSNVEYSSGAIKSLYTTSYYISYLHTINWFLTPFDLQYYIVVMCIRNNYYLLVFRD